MSKLTIVLNRNHIRALAVLMAENDIRYYLMGVQVEVNPSHTFLAATDGTKLGAFKCPTQITEGTLPEGGLTFIMPAVLVKGVKSFKTLADVRVSVDTETQEVTVLDVGTSASAKAVEGLFPDWRRVVPAVASNAPSQFNPEIVAAFGKVAKLLGAKPTGVHIFHSGTDAAVVRVGGQEEFVGVAMPLRLKPEQVPAMPSEGWKLAA